VFLRNKNGGVLCNVINNRDLELEWSEREGGGDQWACVHRNVYGSRSWGATQGGNPAAPVSRMQEYSNEKRTQVRLLYVALKVAVIKMFTCFFRQWIFL
jgi:hypothetical protein